MCDTSSQDLIWHDAQETLRLYPPVGIGQIRVSRRHDMTLAGKLHLPRGTMLWVPHHAIQNTSFNWDYPDQFVPGALGAAAEMTARQQWA